ncbi:MAG: class I tRNA ligase family protein, partial [Bacteroidales bacterium]|nr:class I tRNA ligase family protein [Bacteroidales bacterium]
MATRIRPIIIAAFIIIRLPENISRAAGCTINKEPYTIVIPPPNVTGVLHMGHMLNNTIQDVLVRKARLSGKN